MFKRKRRGIITKTGNFYWRDYTTMERFDNGEKKMQYVVKELEQVGGRSRIKILSVSGDGSDLDGDQTRVAESALPEWIPTDTVEWIDE